LLKKPKMLPRLSKRSGLYMDIDAKLPRRIENGILGQAIKLFGTEDNMVSWGHFFSFEK
jgi:hypothetical protein